MAELTPGSPLPPPRHGHAAAWDGRRGVIVIHGGCDGTTVRGDAWTWNGREWAEEAGERPDERFCHAMAYDATRQRLVLYGGSCDPKTVLPMPGRTVWERDRSGWSGVTPADGPGPRSGHGLVWDPARRRVVLFGGRGPDDTRYADLWAWDGARWALIPPGPAPPPTGRMAAGLAWDARRDVLVVVGASFGAGARELHEWSPTRGWSGPLPVEWVVPRAGVSLAAWPSGLVLFGGTGGGRLYQDTWARTDAGWARLVPEGVAPEMLPQARRYASLVWDPVRHTLVLFGGISEGRRGRNDTWVFHPQE